jgi:GntR family transcriptional regulator
MEINIDSPLPVYEQITQQVIQAILGGTLSAGDSLPPIRQLASDLDLNPNTVAKAYKQLETQRVIFTAGRKGAFIHQNAQEYIAENNNQDAQFQLDTLLASLKAKGMNKHDVCELLEKKLNHLRE